MPAAPVPALGKTHEVTAPSAGDVQDLLDLTGRVGPKCELQKLKLARSLAVSAFPLGEEVIVARAEGVVGSRRAKEFFPLGAGQTLERSWSPLP